MYEFRRLRCECAELHAPSSSRLNELLIAAWLHSEDANLYLGKPSIGYGKNYLSAS